VGGSAYFLTFHLRSGGIANPRPLCPQERAVVKRAILFWHGKKWAVNMLTVMPDHVHILARPLEISSETWPSLGEILKSVKRASAREINRRRGERGALWQADTFDHIIRSDKEFDQKASYILGNAVKAGLVEDGWTYDGLWLEGDGAGEGELDQVGGRSGGLRVRPTEPRRRGGQ
jgi:REP element-mobilizing transposase RayT